MTRRKASGQPKRKRRPPPPKLTPQRNKPHAHKPAASQPAILPEDAHGELPMWIDQQGLHLAIPGDQPDPQLLQRLSETFQQKLRDSPLYRQLVDAYGPAEAEKIIQQCRAQLR